MAKVKKKINIDLKQRKQLLKMLGINSIDDIDIEILKRLKNKLVMLTDSRQKNKTHYKIWDIVMCVVLASFSECYTWDDIVDFVEKKYNFIRQFLKMTGGIPTAITYERVFSIIDSKELEQILTTFLLDITMIKDFENDIIPFDGRVDCGSSRKITNFNDEEIITLNCLNAYSTKYSICIGSEKITDKSNEIPAIPLLINRLKIAGAIVTWDALNTQIKNIEAVVNAKADYVVALKGNQGTFYDEVKEYFDDKKIEMIVAGNSNSQYKKIEEKSHSNYITYEYFQTNDTAWYSDKENWKKLTTIGLVIKTIESIVVETVEKKKGKKVIKEKIKRKKLKKEKRYYISSLNLNIELFSKAIRSHWEVENKLHWHLDFTFKEDDNTTANKNALLNLQLVNKFTLGVLEQVKPFYNGISLRRIKHNIDMDFENEYINLICYLLLSRYKRQS